MKPAVVMMFRDEADILERCLQNWYDLGVRNFYLCDNGSDDNSREIAQSFLEFMLPSFSGRRHWVIEYDSATDWPGRRVINGLKQKAINDGCDWIFPADADEFLEILEWGDDGETIKLGEWLSRFDQVPAWGEIRYLNVFPDGRAEWQEPHRKAFGILKPEWMISMGNHLIEGIDPTLDQVNAFYLHYPLRTYAQFRRKMVNYMTAFSQTEFKDHHHSVDFHRWQVEGEAFLEKKWKEITQPEEEPAPKWL